MMKDVLLLLLSTLLLLFASAQQQWQEQQQHQPPRRNLRVTLDPKTVELKLQSGDAITFNPTPEEETYLAQLKYVQPAIAHTRPTPIPIVEGEITVDVVSIGSNTRFNYMTSQLNTWASTSRNFYGFSESTDFDPQCTESLNSDPNGSILTAYLNTCRDPKLGTKAYGIGHGKPGSGGWFCAQRRPGRALGWLQAVYGPQNTLAGDGNPATVPTTVTLPDILIIVDDDTSVDIDKVRQLMSQHEMANPNVPHITAGSVFQLGKYGGFKAAHGGFGTYLNRAALERFTQPLNCETTTENVEPNNEMCKRLSENRGGEHDVYRPGDSVFDLFYKLASRPYFCFHSDWMMGYMITNYAGVELLQVDPPGKRGYCGEESINCHYQNPELMEEFWRGHPQQMQMQSEPEQLQPDEQIMVIENNIVENDANNIMAAMQQQPQQLQLIPPHPNQEMINNLKQTEDIWLRGSYAMPNRKGGRGVSNYWGNEPQVSAARARAELEYEANSAVSPLAVCDRRTYFPVLQYPNANNVQCTGFTQDQPMLLLEGSSARGRTGNNLVEFFHAVQIARDRNIQIGITSQSWAMKLITQFWFETMPQTIENTPSDAERFRALEETFCMKIFNEREKSEMAGWDFVHMFTGDLFSYHSDTPMVEYMPSQLDIYRRLFSHYNTGQGLNYRGLQSDNMCVGLEAMFPTPEERSTAIYTVIHSRKLEGAAGIRILGKVSKKSGCDPMAALEMRPEYIKAILEPLGMLQYPIIFISDGEDATVLDRLRADPDIGMQIRTLDRSAVSLGGDITMAIMSNVFIGNPASSFSTFIGKARMAMGFGHNELYWAIDPRSKKWRRVCGDHCLFDYAISGAQI